MSTVRVLRNHLEMFQITYSNALTTNSLRAQQPSHITLPLKIHQLASLKAMREKESSLQHGMQIGDETLFSTYAILGDAPGTGKTLTCLGHISQMSLSPLTQAGQTPIPTLHHSSTPACFSIRKVAQRDTLYDSLIVIPHILYKQWQDTITTHTTLKANFLKTQRDLDRDSLVANLQSSHVTLISNTLLAPFLRSLQAREIQAPTWRRVFFDEADTIKLSSACKMPNAHMTWYITSSWVNLLLADYFYHTYLLRQISPDFLQSLCPELQAYLNKTLERHPSVTFFRVQSLPFFKAHLKHTHPFRAYLVVRSESSFLRESLQLPDIQYTRIRCRQPLEQVLDSAIPPEVEAMLHAGDIQVALQTLGVPEHTPTSIVEAVTQYHVRELEALKRNPEQTRQIEERIQRKEAQIQGIQQRLEQASKEVCAICYDPPENSVLTPCCSKLFCGNCMLQWMLRLSSCPLCRKALHPSELKHIGTKTTTPTQQLPKKHEAFLQILRENPQGKFIVFSKYDNPLTHIQQTIEEHYSCQTIQGNKDSIAKQLAAFEEGTIQILLLNSRFAAAGLDIPSATHLILYHNIGAEEERQILGRALRIGRTTPLQCIQLLHPRE